LEALTTSVPGGFLCLPDSDRTVLQRKRATPVREHRHDPNQTHLQRRSAWLHHHL